MLDKIGESKVSPSCKEKAVKFLPHALCMFAGESIEIAPDHKEDYVCFRNEDTSVELVVWGSL